MARFDDCLDFVLAKEGGKVDDPHDRGGRTAFGVTQVTYDNYRVKRGLPQRDVWDIERNEIKDIYLDGYWLQVKGDQLPAPLDLAVFDAAVNCGPRRVARWLQAAIGMAPGEVDGVLGANTLRYIHDVVVSNEVNRTFHRFQKLREEHYADLCRRDPSQNRFINGWNNRIIAVNQKASEYVA
jgi:lysozyme family protein